MTALQRGRITWPQSCATSWWRTRMRLRPLLHVTRRCSWRLPTKQWKTDGNFGGPGEERRQPRTTLSDVWEPSQCFEEEEPGQLVLSDGRSGLYMCLSSAWDRGAWSHFHCLREPDNHVNREMHHSDWPQYHMLQFKMWKLFFRMRSNYTSAFTPPEVLGLLFKCPESFCNYCRMF